jgi:hypothetical protein
MNKSDYQAFQKNYWISKGVDWNKSLHDGYFNLNEPAIKVKRFTDNSTSVTKKKK